MAKRAGKQSQRSTLTMGMTQATTSSVPRRARAKSRVSTINPPESAGKRVGTKRRDMRWQSPDGSIWASRFEYQVFTALKAKGYNVRRATEQDSLVYTHAVRNGVCAVCGANNVVTERSYTPDVYLDRQGKGTSQDSTGYYIEAKGYLRGDRRALLRSVRKAHPATPLRLIVQRDYKVGKSTLVGWATKFLKIPVHVWNGDIPKDWQ